MKNTHNSFHQDNDLRRVGKDQVTRVVRAVYDHYMSDDPAPDKVIVYKPSLGQAQNGLYQATVKIETNFISHSPKSHKVTILFRLGKNGKLDSSTIQYL